VFTVLGYLAKGAEEMNTDFVKRDAPYIICILLCLACIAYLLINDETKSCNQSWKEYTEQNCYCTPPQRGNNKIPLGGFKNETEQNGKND
jgi:hypothetical protein